jgi:hypothetical protein
MKNMIARYDYRDDGNVDVQRIVGTEFIHGTGSLTALGNLYSRAGKTMKIYSNGGAAGKILCIPYGLYILVFTIIPIYPLMNMPSEVQKLKVPICK